ncbi:nephrocystin-1 [Aplochiton taeniatus]
MARKRLVNICTCRDLQASAETTLGTLKKLTKAEEPAPVGNYEQRKQEEERRLLGIMDRLKTLSLELTPEPEPSPAPDDDDDDDVRPSTSDSTPYVVIGHFKGEEEGDLTVQEGEVLSILRKRKDGWWLAQDSRGNQGVVPRTYLKPGSVLDDEDEEEEEESEDEELAEAKQSSSGWSTVRKAITEIDATDVLSALGAIPAGFRPSTLNRLLVEEGYHYRGSRYSQPELSQSKLSFKDLFLDPDTGRVRVRVVKTCVCVNLWSGRMIPSPGVGVQVLSRHIRLCAFDGAQVLSNIHTVRATYSSKNPKTWSFSPRMSGILPTLLDGNCFLRCDSAVNDLGVLFELGVTFIRNSTGERGDLSCGWAFLKLTEDNGTPIPTRTYELPVHGGTPFEKDVAVDPSLTRGAASRLQQMLQARRQPKLVIKLRYPNTRTKNQLSLLPDCLLGTMSSVHLLALHRQLLADTLLMDRATMQNADLICSPLLATFPVLLDQTDLLDALRSSWLEAESTMSRADKRDLPLLKRGFIQVYMSAIYPLLCSATLPCPRWADDYVEEQRARVIYASLASLTRLRTNAAAPASQSDPALVALGDQSLRPQAFHISELAYDLLGSAR